MQKPAVILFCIFTLAVLAADIFSAPVLYYVAKPLLIPTLILLLLTVEKKPAAVKLVLAGLLFSWAGDVLLMFEKNNSLFFIFGLVAFLTTHIIYICYFLQVKSPEDSLLKKQPWWILVVTGYAVGLVWLLYPHLNDMKIPVMAYAAVISTMLLCSLHALKKTGNPSGPLFVAGALLFVCSDSLLAINKFGQPFRFAGLLIMLTYCLAQYLIVWGVVKREN